MDRRLRFHEILCGILGSRNVYFQPPSTVKMQYPCIIYERSLVKTQHADDIPYNSRTCYSVTVIDASPDSEIPDKIGNLPPCKFSRHYAADNLNHDIYDVYY
jgi:hypothetical protein